MCQKSRLPATLTLIIEDEVAGISFSSFGEREEMCSLQTPYQKHLSLLKCIVKHEV